MRFLFTYLFVALLLTSSILAQESLEDFQAEYSSNPKDDKNIVVSGKLGYHGEYQAIVFDIENDSHKVFDIDIPKNTYIRSIKINAKSNRIAYYTSDSIVIFNYLTFEKIQIFEVDTNIKKSSFSKDGSKYFFYNSTENQVLVYNIDDGLLIASYDLAPVNEGYTFTSFNQFADEIAFRRDSILMFWSIDKQEIINSIPFNEDYTFYSFEDNGNLFSFYYTYEDERFNKRIAIGVAYVNNGIIKDTINTYSTYHYDLEFTTDMRYLLEYSEVRFREIYDLEEDTLVGNMLSVGKYGKINYLYISPDLEYSIILEAGIQSCGINWGDSQRLRYRLSTYNFKEQKQIRPIINKFIEMPTRAVISDDNKYAVVNSFGGRHENILVTIDEKLVKYLKVTDAAPVLFLDKSKYIAFQYYEKIKFYNVETDQFDKEFDIGLYFYKAKYYYTKNGGGRIIVMNEDTINIFKYSDLSLNRTIVVNESGIGSNIRFDGKENLIGYDGDKINKYNIFDESITSDVIENIPDGFLFKRFSPNGRYVLFGKYNGYKNKNYEVGIYDMQTDKFRTKDLASDSLNENSPEFTFGLVGNLPIVWYFYHYAKFQGGHSLYYTYSSYDFDKETISEYDFNDPEYFENGDRSFLSNDYNYYIKLNCPWSYSITKLVDPQSSVETTTEVNGSVYPNPASDFIKLDMNASAMNSSIEIYDAYGKQVMSAKYTGEDIDISKLTAGVYFVKVGGKSWKFIKL